MSSLWVHEKESELFWKPCMDLTRNSAPVIVSEGEGVWFPPVCCTSLMVNGLQDDRHFKLLLGFFHDVFCLSGRGGVLPLSAFCQTGQLHLPLLASSLHLKCWSVFTHIILLLRQANDQFTWFKAVFRVNAFVLFLFFSTFWGKRSRRYVDIIWCRRNLG